MSPATRMHVEALANRGHASHVLNFIKATVGYRRHDATWLLAQSEGGIRFLCFVATLYTMEKTEAALRLDALLRATHKDTSRQSTIHQLQDLLGALEPKLCVSDFAESVAGWESMLHGVIENLPPVDRKLFAFRVARLPPGERPRGAGPRHEREQPHRRGVQS